MTTTETSATASPDPAQRIGAAPEHNVLALLQAGGAPRQQGVRELYARYAKEFTRYFRRHGLTPEAAEDVMQDTFVRVLRALETYRGSGTFEAWLWTVARNTLMSHLRERKNDESLDAMEPLHAESLMQTATGSASNPAAADCVKRSFQQFARAHPEYAETLVRVVVDGWGHDELAQFRQSSYGATREYLSQCRKRLLEFVQPCFDMAQGR